MQHNEYMGIALNLAKKGIGFTSPNPLVGSIVVQNNKIVGRGYHRKAGSKHAEIEAINQAGSFANKSTLYVTLEPCNHYGRTPPCTKKIIEAGIKHVVFAMKDPNPNVTGHGKQILEQHGIKVTSGICEKEAQSLNEYFIKYVQTGLPFIIIKCAITLDGRIATSSGNSKWITGSLARQHTHKIRHSVDTIMVGKNTILTDDPKLTSRLGKKRGVDPTRIVLDTKLSISTKAKIITQSSHSKTYIITGNNINNNKKKIIESLGAKVITLPEKNKKINISEVIKLIGNMGFTSLLVEGGGEVIGSMLSYRLVDKVCIFYAPKILTGNDGLGMCGKGPGPILMDDSIAVNDILVHRFGKDIMFEGYINN